jgi:hypothetical protein
MPFRLAYFPTNVQYGPAQSEQTIRRCPRAPTTRAFIGLAVPLRHQSSERTLTSCRTSSREWKDGDKIRKVIAEEIPARVAQDKAYQNAQANSDKQNAKLEHDSALNRVVLELLVDYTELFKQYSDNPNFKRWLADTVLDSTYHPGSVPQNGSPQAGASSDILVRRENYGIGLSQVEDAVQTTRPRSEHTHAPKNALHQIGAWLALSCSASRKRNHISARLRLLCLRSTGPTFHARWCRGLLR